MKKILYVDMDNVLVDFSSAFEHISADTHQEYQDRLDEVPDIFSLMKPVEGAIESFKDLSEVFDTYVLSTSPWENPSAWSDKLIWIKKHLGDHAYKRLILTHHKNLNLGNYLVDDRLKNGADKFSGEHIHFGSTKYPDWKTVKKYLLTKGGDDE